MALVLGATAGCGGSSRKEFAGHVRDSRDRVDQALAQVPEATTFPDLLERLRTAADEIQAAAEELDHAKAPKDLSARADRLVAAYKALSAEVDATAVALDDVTTARGPGIEGLNFQNWNRVQRALAAFRRDGIEVRPLQPHKPPGPRPG